MEIQLPHNFVPRNYQLKLLEAMDDGIKRAVVVWCRRSGKDKTCFNFMVKKAFERVGTYYYFLPSYTQAKKVIWDNIDNDGFKMLDHIPKEIIKNTNATELKIELINGSIIQLISADEFKVSGVGSNPIGVVFSEFSITKPDSWDYVRPILASNKGWAIFNFTPRGRNHGWKILQQAKENNWFNETLTVNDTHAIDAETLAQEKKEMPGDLFEQEYYCKFIDGASAVFKNIEQNLWHGVIDSNSISRKKFFLGVDLAKKQDFTVLTPFDLTTFKVGRQERFNQIDYNLQKAKIEAAYYKWNKAHVRIDSTGLGEPIYDDLVHQKINIEPYHFTEESRRDLLTNLQLKLEQGIIKIPNDEILINELNSFEYQLTPSHKVKMSVPEGMHDDTVMSLALSVWGMPHQTLKETGQEERDILKNFDAYKNKQAPAYRYPR